MKLIRDIDLDPIKVKLMDTNDGEGWSLEKAKFVEMRYRRFLTLNQEYPAETIVPTKDIDTFWHYHILDTRKYADDCNDCFGFFLHHFPYFGLRGPDDAKQLAASFESTKELYLTRFGECLTSDGRGSMSAECSVGCGSVVCTVGSCTDEVRSSVRPTLSSAPGYAQH
jgi:hypothetical protein